jgi:large subunit ribosomal protein L30
MNSGTVKYKLVKSLIGRNASQLATAKALGLRKIGDVAEVPDTPAGLGQIEKLKFVLEAVDTSKGATK